jgi:hypothetical protein
VVVGGIPLPGTVIAEADIDAARPVVTWDEPPNVRIEVPAWLYENVVHPLYDAVPIDPDVLSTGVAPVAIDPDPVRAERGWLFDDDRSRRGRRLRGRRDGLRLLHHDDGLSIDLLRRAVLGVDDHVVREVVSVDRVGAPLIAIGRAVDPGPVTVSIRARIVSSSGHAHDQR